MKPIDAANYVATILESQEQAKLVILSGSLARGKEKPNDIDIAGIFPDRSLVFDYAYKIELLHGLRQETKEAVYGGVDFSPYQKGYVDSLIERYTKTHLQLCQHLAQERGIGQRKGWPLVWIFGENAKEKLFPYAFFQEEFKVLAGEEYLERLRKRINTPLSATPTIKEEKRSLLSLLRIR